MLTQASLSQQAAGNVPAEIQKISESGEARPTSEREDTAVTALVDSFIEKAPRPGFLYFMLTAWLLSKRENLMF